MTRLKWIALSITIVVFTLLVGFFGWLGLALTGVDSGDYASPTAWLIWLLIVIGLFACSAFTIIKAVRSKH